ncbi:MAG: endonuclease/exonuclease/phosphatase family protein [Candidatus Paracaedibacteraceae bacterium]|nr:endonuclease/exonuclease/phosphatase family protein [Candidatus Paracaedibacteraceae bacterium]
MNLSTFVTILDQLRLPVLFGFGVMGFVFFFLQVRKWIWFMWFILALPVSYPFIEHFLDRKKNLAQPIHLPLKVMHQNCWGENPDTKPIYKQIQDVMPDVILLQECTPDLYWKIRKDLVPRGYALSSEFEDFDPQHHHRYNRLVVLTKGFKVLKRYRLKHHPVMIVHARSFKTGKKYRFISVHLERVYDVDGAYYKEIAEQIGGFDGETILSGDFNMVPWSKHYQDFCEYLGLKDGLKGKALIASYPAPRKFNSQSYKAPAFLPIDRLLISPGLSTQQAKRLPALGSDHYGFTATLS